MWQYAFLILQRQRSRSLLASGGFLLVACTLILLSSTTLTTVVQAKQIISRNLRSVYDLVVLPPQAQVPSGQAIPANLFESYDGGISIQQYEQIKQLPGVEVAAPIGFIKYVQHPSTPVSISLGRQLNGFYRLEWTQTAFDGRQRLVEQHGVRTFLLDKVTLIQDNISCANLDNQSIQVLRTIDVEVGGCLFQNKFQDRFPDVGTFLLAAIDPQAENQLLHLDKQMITGRMLTSQDTLQRDKMDPLLKLPSGDIPNYDVPLLFNTRLPGQVSLQVSLTRYVSNTLDPKQIVARGGRTYLDRLPQQPLYVGEVPLARNDPRLFSTGIIFDWDGHTWQPQQQNNVLTALNFISPPSGLTYQPTAGPAGNAAYMLVPGNIQDPGGTEGTEVAFRNLTSSGAINTYGSLPINPYNGNVYSPRLVGQFDGQSVATQYSNELSWLPEGTYALPPPLLRYDAQGHPVPPTTLLPTTNPASFTLQPPLALTTLAAAQRIKGDRLISVIRVRVSGNVAPDEAGLRRVAQVAQLIRQRTGLQVLVTLGSSPKPTLVYVPGIKKGQGGATQDIAPVGWVEERWVVVGVGLVYLNQLGETRTLLLGSVLLVCLGYLVVTLGALVVGQRREFGVLSALGWEPWQPAILFLTQTFVLALAGGIVGIGLALLIVALIGASPPWEVVEWTLPTVLGLALLSAIYPLWQLWRILPAEVLRSGASVSSHRRRQTGSHLPALGGMAFRNLIRSPVPSLIALGSLFLSAILLTVTADGLLAFRETLHGTLLGDYVLLQTAVPQLASAVFAVLLTFLSVADLLLLQVRTRRKEIGLLQAVGWRPGVVQRLFVQEGLTLALTGAIAGAMVALIVLEARHTAQEVIPVPMVALGSILLMLVISALATIPAVQAVQRTQLMDILRAE